MRILDAVDAHGRSLLEWMRYNYKIGYREILNYVFDEIKTYFYDEYDFHLRRIDIYRTITTYRPRTILHWMIECHQPQLFSEHFRKLNPDTASDLIYRRNNFNDTPSIIHMASEQGCLEIIEFLHKFDSKIIEFKDNHQQSPLIFAASRGHESIVDFLIKSKADLNCVTIANNQYHEDHGKSALCWAITDGHKNIAIKLIDASADINLTCRKKVHAIHLAAEKGELEVLKKLLSLNESLIHVEDGNWQTPLFYAVTAASSKTLQNQLEMIRYLILSGTDVNHISSNKNTVFSHAIENNCPIEIFEEILKSGFDVLQAENSSLILINQENSFVPIAVKHNRLDILELLVNNHPELLKQNNINGEALLKFANESKRLARHTFSHSLFFNKEEIMQLDESKSSTLLSTDGLCGLRG